MFHTHALLIQSIVMELNRTEYDPMRPMHTTQSTPVHCVLVYSRLVAIQLWVIPVWSILVWSILAYSSMVCSILVCASPLLPDLFCFSLF